MDLNSIRAAADTPKNMYDAMVASQQFTAQEISDWKQSVVDEMYTAGFSKKEIQETFGETEPDLTAFKDMFKSNIEKAASEMPEKTKPNPLEGIPIPKNIYTGPEVADTFVKSIEAGLGYSGLSLLIKKPELLPPDHEDMFLSIASQLATAGADIPLNLLGLVGGAVGGAAAGASVANAPGAVAGGVLGGGAGAFALPTALREIMMDHYEKGDVKSFADFWERASAIMIETLKSGAVGAATAGTGGLVGGAFKAAPALTRVSAQLASEIATFTTLGKAFEGQMPEPRDYLEGAIMVGAFETAGLTASKLRRVTAKTGLGPYEVATAANKDPDIKADLNAINIDVPRVLDPDLAKIGPDLGKDEQFPTLGKQTDPTDASKVDYSFKKYEQETKGQAEAVVETALAESPYTDAEQKVLARISTKDEQGSRLPTKEELYTAVMDDLFPLKILDERTSKILNRSLGETEKSYETGRRSRSYAAKADLFIKTGPFDFRNNVQTGTPGLKAIFSEVNNSVERNKLNAYLVSKRAIELADSGREIETGVDYEAAKQVVKSAPAHFKKIESQIQAYRNDLLKYLQDAEIINSRQKALIQNSWDAYIPMNRVMDSEPVSVLSAKQGEMGGRKIQPNTPIKRIYGSSKKIIDPIESFVRNTFLAIEAAEKNRVLLKVLDSAENSGLSSQLFTKKKPEIRKITVQEQELVNYMAQLLDVPKQELENVFTEDKMDIYRSQKSPLTDNEIALYRKGKREVYKVSPDLAIALKSLDRETTPLFMQAMERFSASLRAGTVLTGEFGFRNIFMDQITAGILSKNGFVPFASVFGSLKSLIMKDADYQMWVKSGGAQSTIASITQDYLARNIYDLNEKTGYLDRTVNLVKHPIDSVGVGLRLLRSVAEYGDSVTRIGEFKAALKKAGIDSSARSFSREQLDAIAKAGFDSREITVDFQRMGAKLAALNRITAFFNPHIQGIDRGIRGIKDDPQGVGAKMIALVGIPTMFLLWANWNDSRFKESPTWQKDGHWLIPVDRWEKLNDNNAYVLQGGADLVKTVDGVTYVNTGEIYRFPKPREFALFATVLERSMEEYFRKDPRAWHRMGETLMRSIMPPLLPTAVTPIVEHWANKNFYTGSPIIPKALQGIDPSQQYAPYTSGTAKQLGSLLQWLPLDSTRQSGGLGSPMIIENYIRDWSGQLGMYALQMSDKIQQYVLHTMKKPPPSVTELADIPIIKAFIVRFPTAGAESIQRFYDESARSLQWWSTLKYMSKNPELNADDLNRILKSDDYALRLNGINTTLARHMKLINYIKQDENISALDRKRLIDEYYNNMISVSKYGLEIIDEFERTKKGTK